MKKFNRTFTRMERIRYYCSILDKKLPRDLSPELEKALNRLEYLTSERYQDWSDRVSGDELVKRAVVSKKKTAKVA